MLRNALGAEEIAPVETTSAITAPGPQSTPPPGFYSPLLYGTDTHASSFAGAAFASAFAHAKTDFIGVEAVRIVPVPSVGVPSSDFRPTPREEPSAAQLLSRAGCRRRAGSAW
jgi:hypothetical protein